MKVAILSPYPTMQFAQELGCQTSSCLNNATWTVVMAEHLSRIPQTEVHVLTESEEIAATRTVSAGNVKVHFIKAPARFKTLTLWQLNKRRLHRVLNEIQPDIVHGQGIEHQYGYAAVTSGRPHLVTIHGLCSIANQKNPPPMFSRMWLAEHLERHCLRQAKNLVVINPFVLDCHPLDNGRRRLFHIPNPVSETFFKNGAVEPRADNVVLCVGTIEPLKGADVLLRALKILRDRGVTVRAKVIGQTPPGMESFRAELEANAKRDQLDVEFAGFIPSQEVAAQVRRCAVLVHPSRHEHAPMAIAEAMSAGTPVIASQVGGIPYMIRDGETGFLFPVDDANALADRLQKLLSDPTARARLGNAAHQSAQSQFHPQRVAQLTHEAYEEILKTARS